nr:ankyrin repeat domain-containing protein 36B-like [Megalopta genalis]
MFCKDNTKLSANSNIKEIVEAEIVKVLEEQDYTLNTVNCYGDNLLHISAANDCHNITKEILQKETSCSMIDRKNRFGWTPLMIAIRNRDVKTVKYLLQKNANINESTYLGMSVLGLAAAIDKDMFQTVYEACPSALQNCMHDDITPLCVAAMRNDKDLFFQLLSLGFEISKINEYTHVMMKLSTVPEIRNLAESVDVEDYWNDISDNIPIELESDSDQINIQKEYKKENEDDNIASSLNSFVKYKVTSHSSEKKNDDFNSNIIIDSNQRLKMKPSKLNLVAKHSDPTSCSIISPRLTCTLDESLPVSPNIYFTKNNDSNKVNISTINKCEALIEKENEELTQHSNLDKCLPERPLQRLQSIRPPDLNIQNDEEDLNKTLSFIPEFSPVRSPYVPADLKDENVFGEDTPTPPHYKTPPRGMILNSEETKLCILLQCHELDQHIPIFLEQEVDFELFLSLTDQDLIEIGVKEKKEREAILDVITQYSYYH